MASFSLKPRQKIMVFHADGKQQYQSVIEDLSGDKIYIAIPLSATSPLVAKAGDYLSVRVPMESHCLEFTTRVSGVKIDNIPMYVLYYPENVTRIQMRRDVRLDVLLDVSYSKLPEPGFEPEYKNAMALNISAGGMKISVSEPVPVNALIQVKFYLPVKGTVHNFELKAKVIRSQVIEAKKQKTAHHLGMSFEDINSKQKDVIYQFIFNKMAGMKRSGKI